MVRGTGYNVSVGNGPDGTPARAGIGQMAFSELTKQDLRTTMYALDHAFGKIEDLRKLPELRAEIRDIDAAERAIMAIRTRLESWNNRP